MALKVLQLKQGIIFYAIILNSWGGENSSSHLCLTAKFSDPMIFTGYGGLFFMGMNRVRNCSSHYWTICLYPSL